MYSQKDCCDVRLLPGGGERVTLSALGGSPGACTETFSSGHVKWQLQGDILSQKPLVFVRGGV